MVDESNEHAISHWDWQNKKMISENKVTKDLYIISYCLSIYQFTLIYEVDSTCRSHALFLFVAATERTN